MGLPRIVFGMTNFKGTKCVLSMVVHWESTKTVRAFFVAIMFYMKGATKMKKSVRGFCFLVIICLLIVMVSITLTGCSRNPQKQTGGYNYAIVKLPDDTIISGRLDQYWGYSGGIVAVSIGGSLYRTHYSNVVLMRTLVSLDE